MKVLREYWGPAYDCPTMGPDLMVDGMDYAYRVEIEVAGKRYVNQQIVAEFQDVKQDNGLRKHVISSARRELGELVLSELFDVN